MNVLSLLQTTAYRLGIPAPTVYSENYQLLNLLYEVAEELRNTRAFPQQKRTHTITLVAGTYEYALPADFFAGLLGTQVDRTNGWELVGPLSDGDWNYRLYSPGAATDGRNAYRIFGPDLKQITTSKMMKFDPNSLVAGTVGFDYITGSMFYTSGGSLSTTLKETAAADSDIPMFDDDILIAGLKAAYKESKGIDNSSDRQKFERMIEAATTRYQGAYRGNFAGNRRGRGASYKGGNISWSF